MKLFYNSDGTVKVLPVSALPANTVWNGGFPYTPEGSLLVSIVSAKPTDTVSNGGFIQELWGGVCAGYDTPSIWIGGLAITSYGALCLDVDGGIVTDGPVLNLPLTHTAIPTRGSIVPTFTRATTATGQKWDEAGYLDFTALAGEAIFKGARRVRNRCDKTENLTATGNWAVNANATAVTGVSDPNGGTVATTVTATGATGQFYSNVGGISAALNAVVGNTYINSIYIRRRTGTGTINAITINNTRVNITNSIFSSWARITFPALAATTVNSYIGVELATSGDAIDIAFPQQEDVTGQTTQTAGEYVSVGALIHNSQDPNYLSLPGTAGHYASAPDIALPTDLNLRFFGSPTDLTPTGGYALQAKYQGAGTRSFIFYLAADGKLHLLWSANGTATAGDVQSTVTVGSAGYTDLNPVGMGVTFDVDNGAAGNTATFFTSPDGVTWTQLGDPVVTAGATSIFDGAAVVEVGGSILGTNIPFSGKIFSAQIYNTIGGTTPVVDFNPDRDATTPTGTITSSTTGEVWTINGASSVVRNAAYHGSMVDGVKCYDTDRSGNPISTSGSYPLVGYVPWEARTNLVWPSEDLTSVRYVSGGGGIAVVADQAVAPDGTTTADQLTASGANGTLIQDLGVIASTAQCFSLHLKRKTGTGNIDITLDGGATWTTQTINSTTWTRCEKTQTLANPDVGIRIVTSGDAVYAWGLQCE